MSENEDLDKFVTTGRAYLLSQLFEAYSLASKNPDLLDVINELELTDSKGEMALNIHRVLLDATVDHGLPIQPLVLILMELLTDLVLVKHIQNQDYEIPFEDFNEAYKVWIGLEAALKIVLAGACIKDSGEAWKYGMECLGNIKNVEECAEILGDMKKLMDFKFPRNGEN